MLEENIRRSLLGDISLDKVRICEYVQEIIDRLLVYLSLSFI